MGLQTEFDFTLPKGYIDQAGVLHRHGTMRLATARDEIEPLRDARVNDADDPFLTVLVLARVTRLGTLASVDTDVIESLFAADMAFLQDLYGIINFGNPADVAALQASVVDDGAAQVDISDAQSDDAEAAADTDDAETPPSPARPRQRHIEEIPRAAEG